MTVSRASIPFVSVVIPVHRNPDGLRLCLDALQRQTYPDSHFEVVVVDNGGNEDLGPMVSEYSNARLCYEEVPSSYAARNTGARHARGSVFAFTDSDCIPAPE